MKKKVKTTSRILFLGGTIIIVSISFVINMIYLIWPLEILSNIGDCLIFLLLATMIVAAIKEVIEKNAEKKEYEMLKPKNSENDSINDSINEEGEVFTSQPKFEDLTKDDGWENNDGPIKYR